MIKLGVRKPNKIKVDLTNGMFYQDYLDSYPEQKMYKYFPNVNPIVDKKTYLAVNTRFWELVIEAILLRSCTFKFPFNLGELRIQKRKLPISYLRKKNSLKVDYNHFQKTGKIKYFLNEHRQYYRYKFLWIKCSVTHSKEHRLMIIRRHKRHLAHILKNNNSIDYFE